MFQRNYLMRSRKPRLTVLYILFQREDQVKCFSFGSTNPDAFSYQPSIDSEDKDTMSKLNKENKDCVKISYNKGSENMPITKKQKVFDFDSYKKGELVLAGQLEISGKKI